MLLVVLNILNAIGLSVAIYYARARQIETHKKWIAFTTLCAVALLVVFLKDKYEAPGNGEEYLLLKESGLGFKLFLYAHITAALVSFVMYPLTIYSRFSKTLVKHHKRLAYILYPIWMFSSISGIIVYFVSR